MNAISRPCPEREILLHGLADKELDAANALAMEEHLQSCGGCAATYMDILAHKEAIRSAGLRLRAPQALREKVMDAIAEPAEVTDPRSKQEDFRRRRRFPSLHALRAGMAFSGVALAASLILFVSAFNRTTDLDRELVAGHVRSLLVSHLTDVASSDQHTVKPWYLGKLDFSPPVVDLAEQGYPLIGGRLDYLGGRIVPAIVYKRGGHVINLFVWPGAKPAVRSETVDGYNIVSWTKAGFTYAAVSDLNLTELREFRSDLDKALP